MNPIHGEINPYAYLLHLAANRNSGGNSPYMARAEQKYLVDKETLEHLLAMLRDGISRGASDEEISEQVEEILDSQYRAATDRSLKERAEGRVKRFKNANDMIRDLRSG